jgi:carbonic anhydrase
LVKILNFKFLLIKWIDKGNQKDAFVGKLPLVDEQDSFYAYAVTLHWAMNDQNGSEHEIHDGHKSLGMHIAHYNSKYDNENAAMNDKDSDRPTIVMVAVTFTISDDEVNGRNSEIDKILKVANSTVFYEGSNASLAINLQKIIPKDMDLKFWFYLGSLSTPSCQEKAMWVVANSSLTISKAQLSALRKFRVSSTGPYLAPNARNIQNRNGREVYTSFQEEMRRGPTGNTVYLGMFFILACAGLTLLAVIKAGCCRIYNKPKYEFIEHD